MTDGGNTAEHRRKKGLRKPWAKGESGNAAGVPKATLALRAALARDSDEIHDALMRLVRDDNPAAVIYAHQQIVGKPKEREETPPPDSAAGRLLNAMSDEQLLSYMETLTRHEAAHGKVPQLTDSNPTPASSVVIDSE